MSVNLKGAGDNMVVSKNTFFERRVSLNDAKKCSSEFRRPRSTAGKVSHDRLWRPLSGHHFWRTTDSVPSRNLGAREFWNDALEVFLKFPSDRSTYQHLLPESAKNTADTLRKERKFQEIAH